MNGWSGFADLIFPRTCGLCGVASLDRGMPLCWDCRHALAVIAPPYCACCGEPVHGFIDHDYVCHVCAKRPPGYRRARAAIHYDERGKGLITQFKYNQALWLEELLVELLASAVQAHYADDRYDGVCAVPLHPVKRRERGYNQSALLAGALAKRLKSPWLGRRSLKRIRSTPSQTRLTARQRLTNVQGAFAITRPSEWAGRRILLVDDVMTTGATVGACASVLMDAGATAVDVITVARGI
jgi:competence protein ComFC